jgi:hypothetical protein
MKSASNLMQKIIFYFSHMHENFFFSTNFHRKKKTKKFFAVKNQIKKFYSKTYWRMRRRKRSGNNLFELKNNFFFGNFVALEQTYFFLNFLNCFIPVFYSFKKEMIITQNFVFLDFYRDYIKNYVQFLNCFLFQKIFLDITEQALGGFGSIFVYYISTLFCLSYLFNSGKKKSVEKIKMFEYVESFSKKKNFVDRKLVEKNNQFFIK